MRKEHHRLLGLNALMVVEILCREGAPEEVPLEKVGEIFSPKRKRHRRLFRDYLAAPDLIQDVYLALPLGISDVYEVAGHGLSAFQHFVVPEKKGYRGYFWDADDSLEWLEVAGDFLLSALDVHYDVNAREWGFPKEILANSPMNRLVQKFQGEKSLEDFPFPSAVEVSDYYSQVASDPARPLPLRIKAAAFSLHLLMDACCLHHVEGYLLWGHAEWEAELFHRWKAWLGNILDSKSLTRKFSKLAQRVQKQWEEDPALLKISSVGELVARNADYTLDLFQDSRRRDLAHEGRVAPEMALRLCIRAVATSVIALSRMFNPRNHSPR